MREFLSAACAALLICCLGESRAGIIFDNFSSFTYFPTTSGTMTVSGLKVTVTGDSGGLLTDTANGSSQAMVLGDINPVNSIASLTLTFDQALAELEFDLDAMHLIQNDSITASVGTWTSYPASLTRTGNKLSSTAPVINPGGSGIDDDLTCILSLSPPSASVTFTNVGTFAMDSFAMIPEPAAALPLMLLAVVKRRGSIRSRMKL